MRLSFYHKELANEFKGQFECLEENTEKYKTFSFPTEQETRKIDKDGNENNLATSYKIRFIGSATLWQVHYQILLINFQKEFIKLNAKIVIVFLNTNMSIKI